MDVSIYKNPDGTYTSPKTGKVYKSEKALRSHLSFRRTEKFHTFVAGKFENCQHCAARFLTRNIKRHSDSCYLNPTNLSRCSCCGDPIKNYRTSKGTCSKSCANTFFRSGEQNGNWKGEKYQSICFLHHKKKCVICGEEKIVAVHHYDHNHDNNDPANLVPLCPTHHSYVHSRYVGEVQPAIDEYVRKFIE